jgi:hypothetical protein
MAGEGGGGGGEMACGGGGGEAAELWPSAGMLYVWLCLEKLWLMSVCE